MEQRITIQGEKGPLYDIVLEQSFSAFADELKKFATADTKICIVSDTRVSELYLQPLTEVVNTCTPHVESFVFQEGEKSKTLDTVSRLYEQLILSKFDRSDILIALGGGVVGDLTGYAAATYLRGIRFIQVPTSLLSMVDSSIGGKTGVDFNQYKNMIGAFHQPEAVYINLSALLSLDDKQFFSGFGEIIKHGIIKDRNYYDWLTKNREALMNRDLETLREMAYGSLMIKKSVVECDPKEMGERALLNYGHTLGHAIERLLNFQMLHGECVAVGVAAASFLSFKRGYIKRTDLYDIMDLLQAYQLPLCVSGLKAESILKVTKNDKKMEAGKIKFILIEKIGKAIIDNTVTDEELTDAINYILK